MPFNGGVFDASATRRVLHVSYYDSDGADRTDSYDIPNGTSDGNLNTLVAALGAASNASLWNIGYTNWYEGPTKLKSNAVDETNDDVKDNLVILLKAVGTPVGFDVFVPANNEVATMVAGTANPDPTTAEMIALLAAIAAVWPTFSPRSYRWTKRVMKNKAVKA